MTNHLVTFSDESMTRSGERCIVSAKANSVEEFQYLSPYLVSNWSIVEANQKVFRQPEDQRRAWSWWAFKPLIINSELRLLRDGEYLIYADVGIEFINNVNYIIDRMDQDIFLFGNNWEHAHWCKRDVIHAVWPLDSSQLTMRQYANFETSFWSRFGKQVQASVIFFRVSDYTRKFVKEWLDWCLFEGGRLIDDSPSRTPNHPEFREHRHDQAILTTMAYRDGIKLHWWPAVYNKGGSPEFIYERGDYPEEGYPVLFSHHRRRNVDWEQAA